MQLRYFELFFHFTFCINMIGLMICNNNAPTQEVYHSTILGSFFFLSPVILCKRFTVNSTFIFLNPHKIQCKYTTRIICIHLYLYHTYIYHLRTYIIYVHLPNIITGYFIRYTFSAACQHKYQIIWQLKAFRHVIMVRVKKDLVPTVQADGGSAMVPVEHSQYGKPGGDVFCCTFLFHRLEMGWNGNFMTIWTNNKVIQQGAVVSSTSMPQII